GRRSGRCGNESQSKNKREQRERAFHVLGPRLRLVHQSVECSLTERKRQGRPRRVQPSFGWCNETGQWYSGWVGPALSFAPELSSLLQFLTRYCPSPLAASLR